MNTPKRTNRPHRSESDTSNLEPSFQNMLKVRRKFSCGMISAHKIVYGRKSRQSAKGTSAMQAADGHLSFREHIQDNHLLHIRLSGLSPDWMYEEKNEEREKEMASVISQSGYNQFLMESFFARVKINSFWVWNDADPGAGSGDLLTFLQRLAKDFEQDSFQLIPFKKQITLYRRDLDINGAWNGNWLTTGMGYISKVKTGQVRVAESYRLLEITGPH